MRLVYVVTSIPGQMYVPNFTAPRTLKIDENTREWWNAYPNDTDIVGGKKMAIGNYSVELFDYPSSTVIGVFDTESYGDILGLMFLGRALLWVENEEKARQSSLTNKDSAGLVPNKQ